MNKKFKMFIVSVFSLCLILTVSVPTVTKAETISANTEKKNYVDDIKIDYRMQGDTVIETTSFRDVDSKYVQMVRSVEKDGTGELIYCKDDEKSVILLEKQDYDLFVSLVSIKSSRGATIGSDVSGTQYKHIYISSNQTTINNSTLSQIAVGGAGTAAGIIVSALNVPAGVAVSIGSYIYGAIGTLSPAKMVVNQTLYEVHFSYDDMYYTHCYHEVMKSYDTGGHLIDTTVMYKQAIGG